MIYREKGKKNHMLLYKSKEHLWNSSRSIQLTDSAYLVLLFDNQNAWVPFFRDPTTFKMSPFQTIAGGKQ